MILLKKELILDTRKNEVPEYISQNSNEIHEDNSKLKLKCEELLQKNKRKNSLLNKLKTENNEIRSNLDKKNKEILDLQQKIPSMFEVKQNELADTQAKKQENISKYKSKIKQLEQDIINQRNAFQQQINYRIQIYNALLEKNEENELEYKEIRFELQKKKQIILTLEENIREIQQENESYKSQAISLEESIISISKENDRQKILLENEISLREKDKENIELLMKNVKLKIFS